MQPDGFIADHEEFLLAVRPTLGVNSTNALVISQVVLSLVLPVPMIALVMFTRRADIMGSYVNSKLTDIAAILGTVVIVALNIVLVLQTFGVDIPGLPSS